ncbi:MAG: ribosome recycling factor [Microbacteriaceae bacterium]|jgi:ribosome recycling factor|nr:ribosome recycling factor [Microbacteriaceae bacterium]MBT5248086.1 ribosome recycling factor [Microbacteriaceae bacterium]MBT5616565.1 ribosome recycling factor [Microbacteriaceae bacterium]MBT5730527.1 ribosome recycling factor [Microbacteriaceae bacterium]MBT7803223.1 ribosome recycling factor [Microbacteriaceae bacterium]
MIADVLAECKEKMAKAVDVVHDDFQTVRTGRANPALFQKIMVDYYGQPTPLAQLAGMQNIEARTLVVTPYDKSALKEIEKAITNFPALDASPTNDGEVIRVTMPELTEERRKEYVKIVRQKAEDGRVSVRSVRRKAKDELDALTSEVGEDEVSRAEKELENITKTHIEGIDEALKRKEAELLEI